MKSEGLKFTNSIKVKFLSIKIGCYKFKIFYISFMVTKSKNSVVKLKTTITTKTGLKELKNIDTKDKTHTQNPAG